MFKKFLFLGLLILIAPFAWKQDSNAKTWVQRDTTVSADSILAAIERGDSIIIHSCRIVDSLIIEGQWGKPATIRSDVAIIRTIFSDRVSFSHCRFLEPVRFVSDSFCQDVNFAEATFDGLANFWLTTFGGNALFWGATFGGNADFEVATFGGDADFLGAQFDKKINLRRLEFKNINISWKQLKDHLICDPPVAYKLMKQFEEQRKLDDADGIYLFIKDHERMEKSPWVRYPEYLFIQLTCGYGVKPLRTLIVSLLVILLFSGFYTKSGAIREIEDKLGRRRRRLILRSVRRSLRKRVYDAFYFSIQTFIIGVVPDWHPTDDFLIKFWKIKLFKFRTLTMIEGALGWILLVLFVVTLTRKFIR